MLRESFALAFCLFAGNAIQHYCQTEALLAIEPVGLVYEREGDWPKLLDILQREERMLRQARQDTLDDLPR
jgi:hypothetical protein